MEGLLERELACERRVQHLVREANPRALRREGDFLIRRRPLIIAIEFPAIMKLQHDLIVGAALALRDSHFAQEPRLESVRLAKPRKERCREVFEALPDAPDPAVSL